MKVSIKTTFSLAALLLSSALTAHAAEPQVTADAEFPPTAIEGNNAYAVVGADTIEQIKFIPETGELDKNIVQYNFANGVASYFQLHIHGDDAEKTLIALKPFNDIDQENLAHVQVMGCVAIMQAYKKIEQSNGSATLPDESKHYLQTYCPHP